MICSNLTELIWSGRTVTSHSNSIDEIENFKCEMIFLNSKWKKEKVKKVILFKNQHNISEYTYKRFKNDINLNLPSLYELKAGISRFDQIIERTENSKGVYFKIIEKLELLIPKIKKIFVHISSNDLHIKFSFDGTQIIKQKQIFNLTFTVLNVRKIVETTKGKYDCGIV
jgi:hypothetical protein